MPSCQLLSVRTRRLLAGGRTGRTAGWENCWLVRELRELLVTCLEDGSIRPEQVSPPEFTGHRGNWFDPLQLDNWNGVTWLHTRLACTIHKALCPVETQALLCNELCSQVFLSSSCTTCPAYEMVCAVPYNE